MQTRDQKPLLLDMQEHPENYTDEQLEAMMDSLDQMPDVHKEWQEFEAKVANASVTETFSTNCNGIQPIYRWYMAYIPMVYSLYTKSKQHPLYAKVAASFVGVLLLSGVALAAYHMAAPSEDGKTIESPSGVVGGTAASVRFEEVRLDSILTVVSAHYGKAVRFRSEESKALKFIMTWNPDATLADFVDRMNMFDGLRLTLRQDTIFVETPEEVSK